MLPLPPQFTGIMSIPFWEVDCPGEHEFVDVVVVLVIVVMDEEVSVVSELWVVVDVEVDVSDEVDVEVVVTWILEELVDVVVVSGGANGFLVSKGYATNNETMIMTATIIPAAPYFLSNCFLHFS